MVRTPESLPNEKKKTEGPSYSFADIKEMERLSLEKANKAISAIENALAVWELSKDKPEDLEPRISKLKHFHEALTKWEKGMLESLSKKEKIGKRVERLKEFTRICYRYT